MEWHQRSDISRAPSRDWSDINKVALTKWHQQSYIIILTSTGLHHQSIIIRLTYIYLHIYKHVGWWGGGKTYWHTETRTLALQLVDSPAKSPCEWKISFFQNKKTSVRTVVITVGIGSSNIIMNANWHNSQLHKGKYFAICVPSPVIFTPSIGWHWHPWLAPAQQLGLNWNILNCSVILHCNNAIL